MQVGISCFLILLRWGRTLDSGGRISMDGERLESSGDEDESSKVCAVLFVKCSVQLVLLCKTFYFCIRSHVIGFYQREQS